MKLRATKENRHQAEDQISIIERIQTALEQSRCVLVASHVDPDGDALGTQLAFVQYLRDMGKAAHPYVQDDVPDKYRFLFGSDPADSELGTSHSEEFDTVLALECPQLGRLGGAARFLGSGTRIINIDHHPDNNLEADICWLDSERSSVGEMAYEYFEQVGYFISPGVAEQLYTAILTDTGRFRFNSTSPRTMQIAGELIRCGADPKKIVDAVYNNLSPQAMKLLGNVLNSIEYYDSDRICILSLTRLMLSESGAQAADSEGLVDFTLYSQGSICGALLKEIDSQTTKVSLRSRNGINVSEIATRFGGGGHFNAAGCVLKQSLLDAKATIVAVLSQAAGGTND
ncbi:MAG: bifunctional oligoribonuclease/PAP phosphatase NrnA [bacterium]